jgi:hypothetical protein
VLVWCTRTDGARLSGEWAVLSQPPLEALWDNGVSFRDSETQTQQVNRITGARDRLTLSSCLPIGAALAWQLSTARRRTSLHVEQWANRGGGVGSARPPPTE